MKRYKPVVVNSYRWDKDILTNTVAPCMQENQEEGEWFKCKDVDEYCEGFKKVFIEEYNRINSSQECNCEENARRSEFVHDDMGFFRRVAEKWWICPVHGYKKR